jgi:ATP-dependent exoDNAse (exonuclease V) beta subunit
MLSDIHRHERDKRISFDEPTHTYYVDGSSAGLVSTTTFIHHNFPVFDSHSILKKMKNKSEKYPGMTDKQIKESWDKNGKLASAQGTALHKMIENFYNNIEQPTPYPKEFTYFLAFHETVKDRLTPYRTEWSIFDGLIDLAGQLDMLYLKKDGTYALYDWKRVKEIKKENKYEKGLGSMSHLDHCNYNHYSLQLNVYKRILETRYDLVITEMFLVILHPENENYILEEVFEMRKEIDVLFTEREKSIQ